MISLNQYLSNPLIWLMIILTLFSYQLLLELYFSQSIRDNWMEKVTHWVPGIRVLLTSLPLLGLLGTVMGLLDTFGQMSQGSMDQQTMLSGGIADALLTTEMGLLLVIPGWLLLSLLERRVAQTMVETCAQG